MTNEIAVVLVFMNGESKKAKVKADDLPNLKKGTIIHTKAEPLGYYREGVLESWHFTEDTIKFELEN